jgi:hypothetical protein
VFCLSISYRTTDDGELQGPFTLAVFVAISSGTGGGRGRGPDNPPPFLQDKFCNPFKTEEGVGA